MEGHTSCIIGSSLILFGGKNVTNSPNERSYSNVVRVIPDISQVVSNDNNFCHIQEMISNPSPQGRAYHMAYAYRKKYMVVVGGILENIEEQNNCMRCIDILDTDERRWYHISAQGDAPTSRIHHASSIYEDNLFIHGGYPLILNDKGISREFTSAHILDMKSLLFDTFILNLETMIWRRVTSNGSCKPLLWGHSAVTFSENILVFGGVDVSKKKEVGDIVLWNIRKETWQRVDCNSSFASTMHQAVTVRNTNTNIKEPTRMFVFGGVQFSSEKSLTELKEFDLEKGIWKIVSAKGDIPLGRIGHTLLNYDTNTILMVGGVITLQENLVQDNNLYIYQLGTKSWKKISLIMNKDPLLEKPVHGSREPYVGKSFVSFNSTFKNSEPHDNDHKTHNMGSFIKSDISILQDDVSSLERKNNILYPVFHKHEFTKYHQGNKGEYDLKSEEYDAPPPLPSPIVGKRRQSNDKIHNSTHMLRDMKKIPSENLKEHPKNVGKSNRTEKVSNTFEEYSFEDLGSLMNVSHFLMAGNKNSSKQEENSPVKGKVSYVSPSLIQVMINSTLRRDLPKDLPDHIVNYQPSDDPFSYLKATKTVRRWQEQSK